MQSEDVITELFDNFKYPEFKSVWDRLIPFEQKEITEVIEEALNTKFQSGYKEYQDECENSYNVGFDSGKAEGFIIGLERAIKIIKDMQRKNDIDGFEAIAKLEYEIKNES